MEALSEFVQPILVALTVLLIPATARFATHAMSKKLDEGRELAEQRAAKTEALLLEYQKKTEEQLLSYQQKTEETAAARHKDNVDRFDRIEIQTTTTNGKIAEHDKAITALTAQQELLIRLFPGPQQPERPKQ